MSDLILHHYSTSPFSEKVRLVLGYKKMAWRSVIVPNVMPKPDVMALTGGYRRTPFMQIGADIFCDSALMCRVIDALQPEPPLYPLATSGIADIVAQWADQTLFWTAVPYTMQPAAAPHIMKGATPESLKSFAADRAAMSPNFRRATLADGATMLKTYLSRLEHMLAEGQPFLLGSLPSIADFAAVQSIWFMHLAPPIAAMLAVYPKVEAWYARVKDFGQGESTPMTTAESIAIAAKGELAKLSFIPEPGLDQGEEVTVTPTDYANDPVVGKLVGLSALEVVVERNDDRAGTVHVHFPRIGFQIKKQPI
jgi:glutathione S-transferase